jgi:hypothetical protein
VDGPVKLGHDDKGECYGFSKCLNPGVTRMRAKHEVVGLAARAGGPTRDSVT